MTRIFFEKTNPYRLLYADVNHNNVIVDVFGSLTPSAWMNAQVETSELSTIVRVKRNNISCLLNTTYQSSMLPVTPNQIKHGDTIYWWLEDVHEQGGGAWVKSSAQFYEGELCLIEPDFDYSKGTDTPFAVSEYNNYKLLRYEGF